MQGNYNQQFSDQNGRVSHGVQLDNTVEMANTGGMFVDPEEKQARLAEIMQADHDASQLEQYLLENSRITDPNFK